MTTRSSRLLAVGLWLATMLALSAAVAISSAADSASVDVWLFVPMVIAFATVGAVVAARLPDNPVAWLLSAFGALVALLVVQAGAADLALHAGRATMASWAAWSFTVLLDLSYIPLLLLFLLFPHGRPLSPRWGVVARVVVALAVCAALISALFPVNLANNFPALEHPLGTAAQGVPQALYLLVQLGFLVLFVASVVQVGLRYRRSVGDERQQLRWFAAVALLAGFAFAAMAAVFPEPVLAAVVTFPLIPIAIGLAVLRYRLYELDRLISRAVTYAVVSATLVGGYLAGVLIVSTGLRPLGASSELAVAASTLGCAAAFHPLRRRVQATVDRRFNRARYDAARTVEQFRARMRHELALDDVSSALQTTVSRTMTPALSFVWLRSSGEPT